MSLEKPPDILKWHHAQLQTLELNISWAIHIEEKCNVQVPRVRVLKRDHARNRSLCSAAMWTFCISQVPFLKIHESNKMQSSALWKKQHGNDSRGATWNKEDRLNWRPLNKHHWELMLSVSNMHRRQAEKHQLSNSVQLQSSLFGSQWIDRVCLPLPLHLSPLFLNTLPFFYIPTSLFRKLEMQEHIVTAGCFHLLFHLWHRQEWPTSALQLELGDLPPWTKIFFPLQIMEVADK